MGLITIPKERNVGACVGDINANFKYLDRTSNDKSVSFEQSAPATVWVVLHELDKYPSVTVIDSDGELTLCEIEYTNENTVTLRFSEPTAGKVYLN